jgi:hypothetical protein
MAAKRERGYAADIDSPDQPDRKTTCCSGTRR